MNGDYFESRKEQIEKEFMGRLAQDLKAQGLTLSRKARLRIKDALRDAAMVGASEERRDRVHALAKSPATSINGGIALPNRPLERAPRRFSADAEPGRGEVKASDNLFI